MTIRALIVDDEYPAREELRYLLATHDNVEIIGEAANAREALQLIQAMNYDVIFLDIHMPGMNGIELSQLLKERPSQPAVVFVTAHEEYAVPAFAVEATDYLLKPVSAGRLAETIRRLRNGQTSGRADEPEEEAEAPVRRGPELAWVLAEKEGRQIPIPRDEVVYLLAEGQNVFIQTHGERLLTRFTLQELTERLPPHQFFRCHRSYLINLFQVREMGPYFNGAYLVKMKDKGHSEVLVSRANVKRLKELFAMD